MRVFVWHCICKFILLVAIIICNNSRFELVLGTYLQNPVCSIQWQLHFNWLFTNRFCVFSHLKLYNESTQCLHFIKSTTLELCDNLPLHVTNDDAMGQLGYWDKKRQFMTNNDAMGWLGYWNKKKYNNLPLFYFGYCDDTIKNRSWLRGNRRPTSIIQYSFHSK
jgi:hypothetical protein